MTERQRCPRFVASLALVLMGFAVWPPVLRADEPIDFARQIAPILEQRCLRCHSTEKSKGKLSLSSAAEFRRGGESGPAVVAGKPDESRLIQMVRGAKPEMPASGAPLPARDVERLRQWIAAGAEWPAQLKLKERAAGGLDWWSFQPVKRPNLPAVKDTKWARNDLDKFVLAKFEENGLAPSKEADRRTLIRRLSFDLLGLPPTPEEVTAFERDPDSQAYDKLVDRYLQSPHYGERWARHWLDIAHYADTHGFERDQRRDNAWPYRDYVIRSLNADKRYDDFLREQIAGDVLRPTDPDAITATGFLAAGPWDFVGQVETRSDVLKRAARADDLDDMVTQVMTVSCAMTVNCARCHDHKLDPISQAEYYQLWAVFAGVKRADRPRGDPKAHQLADDKLKQQQRDVRTAIAKLRGGGVSLADIVGGGDGKGTGKFGGGINQLTGKPFVGTRGFVKGAKVNAFVRSTVKFVDGVVVPDASDEGTPISSTGLRVKGVPKTSGLTWDAVRFGPLNQQHTTKLADVDYNKDGHVLLGLHANGAITFDLAELRKAGAPAAMKLQTRVGYFGDMNEGGASVFVYVDGEPRFQRIGIGRGDGPIAIDVDLPETARFLTLMATDNGNGIAHDQVCFIDPELNGGAPKTLTDEQRAELASLEKQVTELNRRVDGWPKEGRVYAVVSGAPPAVKVLHRGDPEQPRAEVKPGTLGCLTGLPGDLSPSANEGARRLALADWIVSPANPLTRRVIVNRLWHHHFGAGLVETPSDFGFGGGKASHPELLDWLAEDFAAGGWTLKRMHRLICTSATYRQQSTGPRTTDSANRLLGRMNARRLDAESLRDAVLLVSGKLNRDMYGPGYRDFKYTEAYAPIYDYVTPDRPELFRRTIYRFVVRTTAHQFLTTLDCPNPANSTPVRSVTTTALQSLTLLNNDFMLRQAGYFADRVRKEAPESPVTQAKRAFALAFGRMPSEAETTAAVALINSDGLPQLCRMLLNANEFAYVD